jgi:hypothetical protein
VVVLAAEGLGFPAAPAATALITWAQTRPWVKRDRIVLVGQSVGGMTTIERNRQEAPTSSSRDWPAIQPGMS